jgi:hypothetical protein
VRVEVPQELDVAVERVSREPREEPGQPGIREGARRAEQVAPESSALEDDRSTRALVRPRLLDLLSKVRPCGKERLVLQVSAVALLQQARGIVEMLGRKRLKLESRHRRRTIPLAV